MIKIQPWMSDFQKQEIENTPAVDVIMGWIGKRLPSRKGGIPSVKIETISDKIMILRSGTGSGKSVTLSPELYTRFNHVTKKNIAVTQPRVLTAMDIPMDIAAIYKEVKMGETIGYQTGDYAYKPKSGIVFMTVGVLSQQLKTMTDDEFMAKYAFVIIDECHDRTLEMDLALALLKQFMHRNFRNKECPFLILTSATFDVDKYADYFGVDRKNTIDVLGLNHPIEENFPKVAVGDYIQYSAMKAIEIHEKEDPGDILIFVYGGKPLTEISKILNEYNSSAKEPFVLIELNSKTFKDGSVDYQNIFKPLSSVNVRIGDRVVVPGRRIIISTNIAETGMTIDTLKYLIDTGYENAAIYNPVYNSNSLLKMQVTRASALQRKGRVGRRTPGKWYPVYTKDTFEKLTVEKLPSIMVEDVSGVVLDLISRTEDFDPAKIDLLDSPAVDSMNTALEKLFVLGMIDAEFNITFMGEVASIARLDLELVRMVLAGYMYDVSVCDLITIAAFMTIPKTFYIDSFAERERYIEDDFIEPLMIWNDFMKQMDDPEGLRKWCESKGVLYEGLMTVITVRDDLISSFIQSVGLNPFENCNKPTGDIQAIKKCIYEGFRMNIARWNGDSYVLDNLKKIKIYAESTYKKIIVREIMLKENKFTGVYQFEGDRISPMSGYVNTDDTFAIS